MNMREFIFATFNIFSKVNAPSLLCTGNQTLLAQNILMWGVLTLSTPEGILFLFSFLPGESGGPCRIFLVTILSTVFILFRGQTNSFQCVVNHFQIWKRTAFLFLQRSRSRVISLQPGSMPACESDTDLCNIEGNRRHQYISWGPLLSHQQCLRMAFHTSELVTGNCV